MDFVLTTFIYRVKNSNHHYMVAFHTEALFLENVLELYSVVATKTLIWINSILNCSINST